jgi:hypothetical protein
MSKTNLIMPGWIAEVKVRMSMMKEIVQHIVVNKASIRAKVKT